MPERPTPYNGPERRFVEVEGYAGPDRRATPGDTAFERAVEAAAAEAAQRVSRVHRVRLVTQAALASFAASLLVMVVLGLVYKNEAHTDTRNFSRTNCSLVRDLGYGTADFVETDADLRDREEKLTHQTQVLSGYSKVFGKTELGKLLVQSHQITEHAITHWRTVDEARLRRLASTDRKSVV